MYASSPSEHRERAVESSRADHDVLAALRRATAGRHEIVDGSMPLSRPRIGIHEYVEHLAILRTWLQPLETWLHDVDQPDIAAQTKLIDADLAAAGLSWDRAESSSTPQGWPAHATPAFRWGARYVVEGSKLGASHLYRRLSDSLRPHRLLFLQRAHEHSAQQWPAFLRELRAVVRTGRDIDAACAGACAGFDALLALCAPQRRS